VHKDFIVRIRADAPPYIDLNHPALAKSLIDAITIFLTDPVQVHNLSEVRIPHKHCNIHVMGISADV